MLKIIYHRCFKMFLIDNQTEYLEVEVENIQRRWLRFSQFVVVGGV